MSVTSPDELVGLQKSGAVVAGTLSEMARHVRPGITTAELDAIGERLLRAHGATPAPRATYGFPGATCISVNEEVAHGIPGDRRLEEGDLVNIDVSAEVGGYYTDTGASFPVGQVPDALLALCGAGRAALSAGLGQVRSGAAFSRLGHAIESEVRRRGFLVIRDLTGHGVGRRLHEEPSDVRSYYEPSDRRRMSDGLVFTIEPMVAESTDSVVQEPDGWTLRTSDRCRVVQYEHTVVTTRRGPIVVTAPGRALAA